jgi:hypothetical protein
MHSCTLVLSQEFLVIIIVSLVFQKNLHSNCTEFRYLSVAIAFALIWLPITVIPLVQHGYGTRIRAVFKIIAVSTAMHIVFLVVCVPH